MNNFLKQINIFGNLYYNNNYKITYKFKDCPINAGKERQYQISGKDKNILTKTGKNGWVCIICENQLKELMEYKWKIKIINSHNKNPTVGVAPIDYDFNDKNPLFSGWFFNCYNSCLYSGPPQNFNQKETNFKKVSNEIIVVMNTLKKTLKFIIDNEDKGESYTNIPLDKPLAPAVALFWCDDKVEITGC